MAEPVIIEVAIESVEDAAAADAGGANRLVLCSALDFGGLTPSFGTFQEVRKATKLPIWVMIRPRAGDFVYSESELKVMTRDMELIRDSAPDGYVFGVLDTEGRINGEQCRLLRYRTGFKPCAFHRAFDKTPNPAAAALDQLIRLGFRRVMTSGGAPTAHEGAKAITDLVRQAAGRIEVIPCGGVNASNAAKLLDETWCTQIHGSFPEPVPEGRSPGVRGYPPRSRTSRAEVAATRAAVDAPTG